MGYSKSASNTMLRLFVLIILVVGSFFNASAGEAPRKIVVFKPGFTDPAAQDILLKKDGATPIKPLRIVNGFAVYLPAAAQNALEKNAGDKVLRIDDDIILHGLGKPTPPPPQPAQELTWNVQMINANLAWPETNGTMVNVAVLDTGGDLSHPDLSANIKGNYNAIYPNKSAEDDNGHGTHVSGIIAAANNTIGVIGVSPQVNLYEVKVLNKDNAGNLSDMLDGMQWCIDNHMRVVNMSFGSTTDIQSLADAISAMYSAGIVMVAAAGNNGASGGAIEYPAKYPQTIAVSSVDINGNFSSSSSYGPEIDLAAPGVNVYSTYLNDSYATLSGTSMAAPHVTAAAALVLSVFPTLTPDEVKAKLKSTAQDLGLPSDEEGTGLVRPDLAIQ